MVTQSKNVLREIKNVLLVYGDWQTKVCAAKPTISILHIASR
jgi:hypothetical protein